jgi:hypothetical protein
LERLLEWLVWVQGHINRVRQADAVEVVLLDP